MIVQVYKNTKTNTILVYNQSHAFDKNKHEGYELIDEFEGETWEKCNIKISQKYFKYKGKM